MKFTKKQKHSYLELSNCIRALAADAVEKAQSGHPGMVLGMADVMTTLAFDFLKFNPSNPTWFNRDRLILSAGHGSMLLYAFYYLAGYTNFNLEDIKNFRQLHSKTPGHPEYRSYPAIEATTGPLGQGIANAVGMAIAQKKYQQKLGSQLCDYKIYCIAGDGCLMEGISYEAISLAGHLKLNNLVILFDDNKISIDGRANLAVSEDHLAKFNALEWNTEAINGHDFDQINAAIQKSQISEKPYFISCRTLIAKGCSSSRAGSEKAHGMPLGRNEIRILKENMKFEDKEFFIPTELKEIWSSAWIGNEEIYNEWQEKFGHLSKEQQAYFLPAAISNTFLSKVRLAEKEEATRASSGKVIEELIRINDKIICGSADLSLSTNIKNQFCEVITSKNFSGNFIHYGVREHAMAAIMNGLALSGFLPIGGTFFVFSDYMRPAIRLSAIMGVQVIYIMTHDSIGVGEDGPTHQPVEHLAAMRAMLNLLVLRPADSIETLECWEIALSNKSGPSMLILTRQPIPQIRKTVSTKNLCNSGAYLLPSPCLTGRDENKNYDVAIFASGSEVFIAQNVGDILNNSGITTKVVSIPCFELFFQQDEKYIKQILGDAKLKVGIEAGGEFGWHRIIGEEGLFFGLDQFGVSAPANQIYEYFGLTTENIVKKIKEFIKLSI